MKTAKKTIGGEARIDAKAKARIKASIDGLFQARGEEFESRFKEVFFFSPSGEPTYKSVLLSRMINESLKRKVEA